MDFGEMLCDCGEVCVVPLKEGVASCSKCQKHILAPTQPGKKYLLCDGEYFLVDKKDALFSHCGVEYSIDKRMDIVLNNQGVYGTSHIPSAHQLLAEGYKERGDLLDEANGQIDRLTREKESERKQKLAALNRADEAEKEKEELRRQLEALQGENKKLEDSCRLFVDGSVQQNALNQEFFNTQQKFLNTFQEKNRILPHMSFVHSMAAAWENREAVGRIAADEDQPDQPGPSRKRAREEGARSEPAIEVKKREETGEAIGCSLGSRKRKTLRLRAPIYYNEEE